MPPKRRTPSNLAFAVTAVHFNGQLCIRVSFPDGHVDEWDSHHSFLDAINAVNCILLNGERSGRFDMPHGISGIQAPVGTEGNA